MVLAVSGNPIQPLPRPNSRFALCLDATLSLHKYSSEGTCLNRGKVKQLYRQTHNTHFSVLSSEYSQRASLVLEVCQAAVPLLMYSLHES